MMGGNMHGSWLGFVRKMGVAATIFLLLFGVVISSCEGSHCRTDDDCSGDLYCRGPNQPNACGIPPRELCASDTDCSMGMVCHALYDPCSTDNIGSECNPPCTANGCGP